MKPNTLALVLFIYECMYIIFNSIENSYYLFSTLQYFLLTLLGTCKKGGAAADSALECHTLIVLRIISILYNVYNNIFPVVKGVACSVWRPCQKTTLSFVFKCPTPDIIVIRLSSSLLQYDNIYRNKKTRILLVACYRVGTLIVSVMLLPISFF